MRLPLLVAALGLAPALAAQPVLVESFAYRTGDLAAVSDSVWKVHSGDLPVGVVAENLTFPNYPANDGNAADVTGGAGSRQDVNRKFAPVTTGSVYVTALVRVDTLTGADQPTDYFLHLVDQSATARGGVTTSFRGRVFARGSGTGFVFGISKASGTPVFEATARTFGTTYLVVVRYTVVEGASNDTAALAVVAAGSPYAQESDLTFLPATDTNTDIAPGAVVLRQGGVNLDTTVDGVRLGTSYGAVLVGVAPEGPAADGLRLDRTGPAAWRLAVREAQTVRVEAFDALGRRVATLADGPVAAGTTLALALDGAALPAGLYVVRATGARGVVTGRAVLAR